ncbi:MAG: DUF4388 domain-containing protein, partial [Deltaproteobacteria bacterium]|nr:DUF4388 domain-containing protein [Deltaproteobacteria bacterium]
MNQVASLPAQGDLAQFPLRDLLQGHAALRSCGRLVVRTSAGEAWVKLWDGAVSEAHFGPATGEAAVLRLMTFQEGGFQFEPHPDSVAGATASAMKDLLDRGEAHHQEVLHHAGKLGGLSAVFTLELGQISRLDADIRQEIAPILGLVDGRRTVQEVVAATEMPDVTVLRVMRKLRSQGLLRSAEEREAERLAREEAQRAAEAAAAAAAEAAAEAARRPPTVEEMMMQQAVRQEDERALLASLAAGVAPPSTEEERKERAARAERFAAAEPTPLTAPPARRNTPPAGMPVAQQGMSPPPAAAAPAT